MFCQGQATNAVVQEMSKRGEKAAQCCGTREKVRREKVKAAKVCVRKKEEMRAVRWGYRKSCLCHERAKRVCELVNNSPAAPQRHAAACAQMWEVGVAGRKGR